MIHGPIASGKLTIAHEVAARSGFALFHNHLVVDAVGSLFPFGSEPFIRLREALWRELIDAAISTGRDVIFTFAPEPTVSQAFIPGLLRSVDQRGARVVIVELTLTPEEQDRRVIAADRIAFGKLRDPDLLRELRPEMARCSSAMPPAALTIDTGETVPGTAAAQILALL